MIDHIHQFVIPAAYDLLPEKMASERATAMILAIGLQESGFTYRKQLNGGPAHGFFMFELGGISGVLRHHASREYADAALRALCYGHLGSRIESCYSIIEHHDTLATVFARLLLWTLPDELPAADEPERAWAQYVAGWRPGRPRAEAWIGHFTRAWDLVVAARS